MKKIENIIATILIKLTFYLTYLLPVNKNKVAIISYFNQDYNLEFNKIVEILNANKVIVKSDLHKFNSSLKGKFLYLFSFIHQTYLFNTAKVIVVDGNSFVHRTINKKKNVHIMQVWHATGAIKKFGEETENRRYKIKAYDSIIVGSEYFKAIFAKALATPLENVKALGVSKTDYLFDQDFINDSQYTFYKKYPKLINKKIVLYAPTFRGDGIDDMKFVNKDIKQLQKQLPSQYQLIVRLHPLIKEKVNDFMMCDEFNLYTMLSVSDIIISDYSALIYDAAILNKHIIMYLDDLEEYKKTRGLSVNIDDFSFIKSYTIKEVIHSITNYKINNEKNVKFINEYLDKIDGLSSQRIAKYILELLKEGN
ncbi:CDP-glycerol glycerophosphotransferase family protein [Mycoplasma sp. P36-A1]|uniref:CDP-glycerol glycerophosphotransferase family protein n=1 Tax=Mycoplasma sp. P36-A1 TaxID=3252900 RepID=UPI003C2BB7D2